MILSFQEECCCADCHYAGCSCTDGHCDECLSDFHNAVTFLILMILSFQDECCCAECHYADCSCADCHYAECLGPQRPKTQFMFSKTKFNNHFLLMRYEKINWGELSLSSKALISWKFFKIFKYLISNKTKPILGPILQAFHISDK
jgi:hypothetical protein